VDRQLGEIIDASTTAAARDSAEKIADSAVAGGRDALVAADAADSVDVGYGGDSLSVESRVVGAAGVAAIRAGLDLKRGLNRAAPLKTLRDLAAAGSPRIAGYCGKGHCPKENQPRDSASRHASTLVPTRGTGQSHQPSPRGHSERDPNERGYQPWELGWSAYMSAGMVLGSTPQGAVMQSASTLRSRQKTHAGCR
jgi:hypothetical protein